MIERLGKFKEGYEQYKKNCYEYEAGASCHSAGHMLLSGVNLPDGTTPVRTWSSYLSVLSLVQINLTMNSHHSNSIEAAVRICQLDD